MAPNLFLSRLIGVLEVTKVSKIVEKFSRKNSRSSRLGIVNHEDRENDLKYRVGLHRKLYSDVLLHSFHIQCWCYCASIILDKYSADLPRNPLMHCCKVNGKQPLIQVGIIVRYSAVLKVLRIPSETNISHVRVSV